MPLSRNKQTTKTAIFAILYKLLSIALGFVSRTIFLWILGVEYLGISGLFGDILQMLSLADLGLSTAIAFSLYKPIAENDIEKLGRLMTLYKKIYRIIALLVLTIGLAITPLLKYIVNLENSVDHIYLYYILMLLNAVLSYLVIYKTSLITADQKGYILSNCDSVAFIATTVFSLLILYLTRSYAAYLIVHIAVTFCKNVVKTFIANKMYGYINFKSIIRKEDLKEVIRNTSSAFIYKTSAIMMNATDNTIISIILGTVVVGYYSNYCLIVNQITNLVNAGMYASTPSVGNLMALENEEKKIEIYKKIQFISNFICLILIPCFFFLINDFINVWLGKGFLLDTISVIAISVNFYLSIALLPIWIFREAAGLYKEVKYVILVAAILNIGLSVLLGLFLGLAGILFASAISRLLTYFWYEPIILFKKYFKERPIYYFVGLLKSMIPMLFIFVPCFFIDKHFSSNTILLFLAKALVILVISLAISVLFFCRNKEFKYFVSLYFRKIAKKKER